MEHAFGRERPFQLGLEEELILVEGDDRALRHAASEVICELPEDVRPAVKHEAYEALVETESPVSRNAIDAAAALGELRAHIRATGARVIGAGIHPTAKWGDVVNPRLERYEEILAEVRGLLRRTPTAAMHMHVGMPDPETAITAYNRMRAHLPLLMGLSANSPYWFGDDSGCASARTGLWRAFPRAILPRELHDWADFERISHAAVTAGGMPDYTFLWWDIRPHPNLGTVEVRMMDAQSRLATVCGIGALTHALLVRAAHEDDGPIQPSEAIAESSFRAARDGMDAAIWCDGRMTPLREVAQSALGRARAYARDAGAEDALEEIERIVAEGNGADRARAAFARGGMAAVLEQLEDEAAAELPTGRRSPASRT